MNEFLFTSVGGVPLILWIILFGAAGYMPGFFFLPQITWGLFFDKYIWNEEYLTEILGEEIMAPHRSRPRR